MCVYYSTKVFSYGVLRKVVEFVLDLLLEFVKSCTSSLIQSDV